MNDRQIQQLKIIKNIAIEKGGECLSNEYINNKLKLKFQCKNNHIWMASSHSIKNCTWCPTCASTNKENQLKIIQDIATSNGGKCLSNEYVNSITKIDLECKKGHRWATTPAIIINDKCWCPICAGKNKDFNFIQLKNIILKKGGICLSDKYISSTNHIKIKCEQSHIFCISASNLKNGSWCPICAGIKIESPLSKLQKISESKGGECLSDKYINCYTKMQFKCKNNHTWLTRSNDILNKNAWCPYCSGRLLYTPLEDLQRVAKLKGGQLLSTKYFNTIIKIKFKCKRNHIFESSYNHVVRNNNWCPICNTYMNEKICRAIFELAFNKEFKKVRNIPNPYNKHSLELDGYNDELKLAFEYNGEQHYKKVDFNGHIMTNQKLKDTQNRDQIKVNYCKLNNIILIVIPYTANTSINTLYEFIKQEYFNQTKNQFPIIDVNKINIY